MLRSLSGLVPAIVVFFIAAGSAGAHETPRVSTNQSYIEFARQASPLDIKDKRAVFQHVLNALPDTVTVYPTENYYYFFFHHAGIKYAGNIRLDIEDRDKGLVHVNYFKDFTPWQRDETSYSALWGAKDGVTVTRLAPLVYQIISGGKSVTFKLIDLTGHVPPEGVVRSGETYIGPVFDESGLRFFLLFNPQLKIFHYVLDETVTPADELTPSEISDRVVVGSRTGFAFYRDQHTSRLILIGVYAQNTQVNNYLDGPFDQLPDNFIKGDALKDAILAASPEMKGKIDRFGNSPDNQTRYLIAPYMLYDDKADLGLIDECARTESLPTYYACFSFENPDQ